MKGKRKNRYPAIVFLVLSTLLLSSCLDIEAIISVNDNGSGTLRMNYSVSAFAVNLGRIESEQKLLALPLLQQDFERAVQQIDGLILQSYEIMETEKSTDISVALSFSNIESLSRLFSTQEIRDPVTLETVGNGRAFRVFIYQGSPEEPEEDIIMLYETLFEENSISITCTFPREVRSANLGTYSVDRRSVTFDKALLEIITSRDPIVWEILY